MKATKNLLVVLCLCLLSLSVQAQKLDSILARLRSDSAATRMTALQQLAKMPANLRASEPMLDALNDSSADVRRETLRTWGLVGNAYGTASSTKHWWSDRRTEEQNRAELEIEQNWQKALIA